MTEDIDWVELHRLNRLWRGWMDAHSPFATPQTLDSLRYASGEAREARLELSAITAELLLRYIAEVAPVDTLEILRILDAHAHEARDLWMRERLPEHARNHTRAKKLRQELAQVVMLILTALPMIDFDRARGEALHTSDLPTIDNICSLTTGAVDECAQNFGYWMAYAHATLDTVAAYPGVDVAADLRECWSQLAWTHASLHIGQYPKELGL